MFSSVFLRCGTALNHIVYLFGDSSPTKDDSLVAAVQISQDMSSVSFKEITSRFPFINNPLCTN